MAHAGTHSSPRHVYAGISPAHTQRGHPVRAWGSVERHILLLLHTSCNCGLRNSLWSLWSRRPTGSDDHSDRPTSRLLLSVVVCSAFVPAPSCRDADSTDWSGYRNPCPSGASVFRWRRREELEAQANCSAHDFSSRCLAWHSDSLS